MMGKGDGGKGDGGKKCDGGKGDEGRKGDGGKGDGGKKGDGGGKGKKGSKGGGLPPHIQDEMKRVCERKAGGAISVCWKKNNLGDYRVRTILSALPEFLVGVEAKTLSLYLQNNNLTPATITDYMAPCLSALLSRGVILNRLYLEMNPCLDAETLHTLWYEILEPQYSFLDAHPDRTISIQYLYTGNYPPVPAAKFISKILSRHTLRKGFTPLWVSVNGDDPAAKQMMYELLKNCGQLLNSKGCLVSGREPGMKYYCGDSCHRNNKPVHIQVPNVVKNELLYVGRLECDDDEGAMQLNFLSGLGQSLFVLDPVNDSNFAEKRRLRVNAGGHGQSTFLPDLIEFLRRASRGHDTTSLSLSGINLTDADLTTFIDTWLVPYIATCRSESRPLPTTLNLAGNRLTETSINHLLEAVKEYYQHTPLSLNLTDNPITPSKVNEALLCHKGKNCVDSDCEFNKPVHAPLWRLMRVGGQEELQKVGEGKLVVCVGEEVGALFKPTNLLQERMGGKLKERVVLLLFDSAMRALDAAVREDGAARHFAEVTLNNLAVEGVAHRLPERAVEEPDQVIAAAVKKAVKGKCVLLSTATPPATNMACTPEYVTRHIDVPSKQELLVEMLAALKGIKTDWLTDPEVASVFECVDSEVNRVVRPPPPTARPRGNHQFGNHHHHHQQHHNHRNQYRGHGARKDNQFQGPRR